MQKQWGVDLNQAWLLSGINPTIRQVPNKVIIKAASFIHVKDSLNKRSDSTVTNAGAVYNNAVANGIVDNSIAVNMQ